MWKWPIIRHVRYFYHLRRMNDHYDNWKELGYLPTYVQHDLDILNKIWRGEA